ncbi:SAM-dependent methyltransferase [Halalkaliarchaeum desulfuricum]|uniref:SAM-dependent methyltransferase n=2 Tax=Halalkaliarchaeum desulfuricum TaxID=2055893 RepID=A0A343TIX0_9EURY|nr:SAM-dependent methyltransferase [Halalkaliarchaeum desulfuricum]
MWAADRTALTDLELGSRRRILDVGCGTGEFTRVLAEEVGEGARLVGVDADSSLLSVARERWTAGDLSVPASFLRGDATRLPFGDGAFDLVVCQALLANLPDPAPVVREFVRVSSALVAAVEPDNVAVAVSSTVEAEETLELRVREAYIDGVGTDVAIGDRVEKLFADAELSDVRVRRYLHEKRVEPPYSAGALESAARKASGAGLADHARELRRALGSEGYDDLRGRWRRMGRSVVDQMRAGEYERVEIVPFYVTVGRL